MTDFKPGLPHSLSARLSTELEQFDLGRRFAVYLVLKNLTAHAITATNRPLIDAGVFDNFGAEFKQLAYSSSGPEPLTQWAVIPKDAYLGLRIDDQGVGIPNKSEGRVLMAVGGKSWALLPGKYTLRIVCEFTQDRSEPNNQWVGRFDPLSASFEVEAIDVKPDGGTMNA